MRLAELLDIDVLRKLTDANYKASGMPIGLIDAVDGSVLIGVGWQDICVQYHRVHAISAARCHESDDYIKAHLVEGEPTEYRCKNGLRDIGIPIIVAGQHLATLFMGQFFYEGENADREFFVEQARQLGFDAVGYLQALDRVPVFSRIEIENILTYNTALAKFIGESAEATLRRRDSGLLFQNMLEGFAYCRMIWGADGRATDFVYLDVNEAFYRLTGLKEVVGKKVSDVIPGIREAHPGLLEAYGRVARTGRPEQLEIHFQPLGMWLAISLYQPRPDHFVAVFDNITERKAAEEGLRGAVERLRDADRRKDEFLGMLSHELRNPLAPIRNAVYVLRQAEPGGEQARRAQAVIERQSEHLARIVNDLVDVSRIVRGKIELHRADVDFAEVVSRTAEDYRGMMNERGLRLTVAVPGSSIWIRGDETRLAQVLGNLLHNAAKFTPEGGAVAVTVAQAGHAAELRVRDTGVGIAPEMLNRIFEPFAQGEQGLARSSGGLGLGLALVNGIVNMHGGTATATSEGPGRGAEFTIRIPVLSVPAASASARVADRSSSRGKRLVVVVDDNHDAADSLAEIVRMLGYEVEVAYDGPSAVNAARANPPDVVLCDIGLPGMDGYDVARALRAHGLRHTRLVAVTGYTEAADVQKAIDAGFDAHVPKPPDPDEIERLLG